jgi:hypothetical protein
MAVAGPPPPPGQKEERLALAALLARCCGELRAEMPHLRALVFAVRRRAAGGCRTPSRSG